MSRCSTYSRDAIALNDFVMGLAAKVQAFQSKMFEARSLVGRAGALTASLTTCPFDRNAFVSVLDGLREVVRTMTSAGLSNVVAIASSLDDKVGNRVAAAAARRQ